MTTVIFGAGFLGQRLARDLPGAVLARVDVTDKVAVLSALREHRATAVINAAGKTGQPNVDWCETHPVETFRANVLGSCLVADACAEVGAYLLHLGSGCIFYGPSPQDGGWRENDHANPSALYSRTKYAADVALSVLPNVGVARLRMPIDSAPGPRNLITKLSKYNQVVDVENSVTVVEDLVQVVAQLVERRATGVFHVTNPGTMRHRDLIELYRELVDSTHSCEIITAEQLVERGLAAKARSNCILSSQRLADLGISMRPINLALRDAMSKYAAAAKNG